MQTGGQGVGWLRHPPQTAQSSALRRLRRPRFRGPAQVPTPVPQPVPLVVAAPTPTRREDPIMPALPTPSARVSRRALMGASLAGAAVVPLAAPRRAAAGGVPRAALATAAVQETPATPDGWRTWYLDPPDELRPAYPGEPGQAEIDEVVAAQANPSEE